MDNVINDTTLTLTSFDNLITTDGSLTMPDGGYSSWETTDEEKAKI